ncbi:MAG TPA: translation elongation factor Ts [Candidatus Paceibacterota bacterium]|nr:translation elongation factor Ts [Candidatus Paceibacterota bacterium]
MAISAEAVKELRDKTGISMMECKKALEEAEGNMDKAVELLQARSSVIAAKKADRELGAGMVASYIHNTGQVGAMVLLVCETDFVSKNEEFAALARDIAMHVSAMRNEDVETLMTEQFIKDPSKTIKDLLSGATQKFGERVEVAKVSCFSVR